MKKVIYSVVLVAITWCVAWSQDKIAILEPIITEGNVTIGQQAILRAALNKTFYEGGYEVLSDKRMGEFVENIDFSKDIIDEEALGKFKEITNVDLICRPFVSEKEEILYVGLYLVDIAMGQKRVISAERTKTEPIKKIYNTCSVLMAKIKYGMYECNVSETSVAVNEGFDSLCCEKKTVRHEYPYDRRMPMVDERVKCRGRALYDSNGVLSKEQVYAYLQESYQDWDNASKKRETGLILMGVGYGVSLVGFTTSLILLGTENYNASTITSLVATIGTIIGVIGTPMFVISNKQVNEIMRSGAYRQSNYQTTAILTFGQQTSGLGVGLRF